MLLDYFSKKCRACDIARKKYLPTIKMGSKIRKYNVERFRYTSKVRRWRDWANGYIPSIQLDGNRKVERYVGLDGFEELANKTEKGKTSSKPVKIGKEENELNLDLKQEVKI